MNKKNRKLETRLERHKEKTKLLTYQEILEYEDKIQNTKSRSEIKTWAEDENPRIR